MGKKLQKPTISVMKVFSSFALIVLLFTGAFADDMPTEKKGQDAQSLHVTADHSKFPVLQKKFKTGPDVTEACLSCHTEAAGQFMKTIHWTWKCTKDPKGRVGKGGLTLNNF